MTDEREGRAARTPTTPVQWVGLGMVFIVANAYFPAHPHPAWRHYDALPDPIGWVLVLFGVFTMAGRGTGFETVKWVGVLAAVVSLPAYLPQLTHDFTRSGQWGASMPQTVFCLMLAREIGALAALAEPRDGYVTKRFGLLSWGFAVMIVLPPIAFGGGVTALDNAVAAVALVVSVAFVFYLFMVHRRTYLGGPGPRDYSQAVANARTPLTAEPSDPAERTKAAPRHGERPSKQSVRRRRRSG